MIIGKDLKTEFAAPERLKISGVIKEHEELLSRKDLHLFYDYTPDFVVVLNQYRQIIFANKTLLSFLNKDEVKDILGSRPGEVFHCQEAFKTAGGCGTSMFCRGCGAAHAIIQAKYNLSKTEECYIQTSDCKKSYNFRVWASCPWKDKKYILFIVRDIADEKLKNALEQTFFHDLTNTACDMQSLLNMIDSHESYNKFFPLLNNVSREILEEINGQRDLRYAEEGTICIQKIPVNALDLLLEFVDIYKTHKISEDIKLQISEDSENISFKSDERLLMRVIENMLKNAIEASHPGQVVTLSCKKENDNVVFSVHNDTYIKKEAQLNIFKRSFSTKSHGRGWGTYGMRLLTERYLGGKISFTSEPESGTTFYACYPLDFPEK
jgi:hypothetical protein